MLAAAVAADVQPDRHSAVEQACALIATAVYHDASLIVFPTFFIPGAADEKATRRLRRAAREGRAHVVIGFSRGEGEETVLLIDSMGKPLGLRRRGQTAPPTYDTPFARLGLLFAHEAERVLREKGNAALYVVLGKAPADLCRRLACEKEATVIARVQGETTLFGCAGRVTAGSMMMGNDRLLYAEIPLDDGAMPASVNGDGETTVSIWRE